MNPGKRISGLCSTKALVNSMNDPLLHKGFGEQHERPVSGVDRASGIDLGLPTLDQIQTVVQPVNERTAVDDIPDKEVAFGRPR